MSAPHAPRRMLHTVFQASSIALRRISPIVLDDELFQRALSRKIRIAAHRYAQLPPVMRARPGVVNGHTSVTAFQTMRGRPGYISLVVKDARDRRHGPVRDDLANERHASFQFISFVALDVQAQIDLVKIAVKKNRHTKHLHVKKAEPDQTDETPSLPQIELCSRRNQPAEQCWIDLII